MDLAESIDDSTKAVICGVISDGDVKLVADYVATISTPISRIHASRERIMLNVTSP